jgi:hypothetical protein
VNIAGCAREKSELHENNEPTGEHRERGFEPV